jgi:hypothetical protein
MKNVVAVLLVIALTVVLTQSGAAQGKAANKYVGVKTCSMCHKATTGNQFAIWQKTKHSGAYNTLKTPKADEIAKAKGLKKPAADSPECLECHVVNADAAMADKTFDMKDGVQCEVCHGAGSAYKAMPIMKDKAKAIAAGLTEYKDAAAIEAKCKSCHNEKSPTKKVFDFKTAWESIKHPMPKKG